MWTFGMHCSLKDNTWRKYAVYIHKLLLNAHGVHAISLDFDHPVSYYTRKKVTYELVTHEYNKLEVGE